MTLRHTLEVILAVKRKYVCFPVHFNTVRVFLAQAAISCLIASQIEHATSEGLTNEAAKIPETWKTNSHFVEKLICLK